MSQATKDKIFNADLMALKEADLTVALITGQDIDSGTAAEIGFTYANDRPIIAITAYERRFRNLFVDGMISKTVNDVGELLSAISAIRPQRLSLKTRKHLCLMMLQRASVSNLVGTHLRHDKCRA